MNIIARNHNGRTSSGKFTFRSMIEIDPENFPPDSLYWENCAWDAHDKLIDAMGPDAYLAWFDITAKDDDSWKVLAKKQEEKLSELDLAKMQRQCEEETVAQRQLDVSCQLYPGAL